MSFQTNFTDDEEIRLFASLIMEIADLIRKVREIEIRTRRLSRHLFIGGYHSAFKGRGMSFSEVRSYQYGDDVRNIDWNVTARTGEPFIKIFEEEREVNVLLVADVSPSSFFGTGRGADKQDFITELCAVLAFSADSNHDKTGLLLYSDQPEMYVAPAHGRPHNLRIIRELLQVNPKGKKTDLATGLIYTRNILKKQSVCFIISDFYSTTDYEAALKVLARRHDCVGIHIWDPSERQLPDLGLLQVLDPESGETRWTDTTDPATRKQYTARFDAHLEKVQSLFRSSGSDFISLRTDEDYNEALLKLFEMRRNRQ
jgi:uncharacterized protein (DUF58 family)